MTRKLLGVVLALIALLGATSAAVGPADAHPFSSKRRPVVFVHGFVGSGGQFETQAMRFTGNGYRADAIAVEEYDSTFATTTMEDVWTGLDRLVARLLDASHADKVELVGHSLGTTISQGYLRSSPRRASRIAHYVNLDGATADSPPGGVPTLAVWGEGNSARNIVGAINLYEPDQSHVQVASSAETFRAMYRFFTGQRPRTTDIVQQRHVVLSGRANLFPTNAGAAGTTLQIWEISGRTGFRKHKRPGATFSLGPDGSWGPFLGSSRKHYEMAIVWPGSVHHFYFQPFLRSNRLIRLLTQVPGTGLDSLREKSPGTVSLTFVRYKELWGDQNAQNDVLSIDGQNILSPSISPRAKRLIGLFAFDDKLDGATDLNAPIPEFAPLPFISGADVFMPASTPPHGTVHIEVIPRGGRGRADELNIPNWASSTNHSSIQLRDFVQSCRHSRRNHDGGCRPSSG